MSTTEMVTSFLEARYVDRAKLNTLLQALFRQRFNVVVSGDTVAVEGPRALTEVRILNTCSSVGYYVFD
ncbi:hypothetical protein F4802DRAFT_589607 [Xylaria palmicola]|nr:hypothetical protein F4802DRAFT_589607 [Xylaria palmicola]